MARKAHPADIYAAEQIAAATSWCATYPGAQGGFTRVECTSAEHALAEADRLTRELGRSGRRACAYAITAEGRSYPLSGVPFKTQAERAAERAR